MFTMQVEDAVKVIVEAVCPIGSEKALYVCVRGRLEHPGTNKSATTYIHLVFSRKTNYTKVFACQTEDYGMPSPDKFVMRSDHDSCWRSDGLRDISESYFKLARKVDDNLAPIDLNDWSHIDFVEPVNIEFEKDKNDSAGYKKILTKIVNAR